MKRGKFSTQEENYIINNIATKPIEDIASHLNRKPETIQNWARAKNLLTARTKKETEDRERLKSALFMRSYWSHVEATLFDNEIDYYINNWIDIVLQFGEDVTPTEELIINDWLITKILQLRSLQNYKQSLEEISRLERDLEQEYSKPLDEIQPDVIALKEQVLGSSRSAVTKHADQNDKFLNQIKHITQQLKATREKRRDVKVDEDTWWGYVSMLDDEKFRKEESKKAELTKLAGKKARRALMEMHKYMDGDLDAPILNEHSAQMMDMDHEEKEKYIEENDL